MSSSAFDAVFGTLLIVLLILGVAALVMSANKRDEIQKQNFMECIEQLPNPQWCYDKFVE